ncbi:Endoglucanase A precursor [Vibrio aerogenes CECT 7868]|uniref:Endoglucanase n=1 Tax=Vibrio aerogenes CECT 7868 TaxID=1216006 RepID=A0A1M5ZKC3_9VIBR|nr:cellulase family glycosylhydrolase [Vibrio aerogenes]SHI24805.1 Endoglucanase A precursor [Vibrio aerogenes CECT 7868]
MFANKIKRCLFPLKSGGLMLAAALFSSQALAVQCDYTVKSDWGAGFVSAVTITNDTDTAINGWDLELSYTGDTTITSIWSAKLSGTNPYTISDMGWNGTIEPGKSVEFGFQGDGENSAAAITRCLTEDTGSTDDGTTTGGDDGTSTGDDGTSTGGDNGGTTGGDDGSTTGGDDSTSGKASDAVALTELMGVGWNAGNTLDAIGGETAWGNPKLTQKLFDAVKAAGFKTVRLPVAWSKFSDESTFTIKDEWMTRVEEVVNYALKDDLYVLLNIHWDGGWMQPTYEKQEYVNNRLAVMWKQIATHFKDYDHRLLFAGTNEVMVDGDYSTPKEEYYTVQNSFNQTFVDTVRATGGKNADRFLVVQGFNTNIDHAVNFATIPTDTVTDHLLMEVHYYDPYNFTLNENSNITQWGKDATDSSKTETWANESYVDTQFQKMNDKFVAKGVGVIMGEYGAISRLSVDDHKKYRVYWDKYITQSALEHQMVPVYWDNGVTGDKGFAIFDRNSGAQLQPEVIQAIVNSAEE